MRKALIFILLAAFLSTSVQMPAYAQIDPMPYMPLPGTMVSLSPQFTPAYLKGIVIHPNDPFKFDFIVYKGDKPLTYVQKKEEYTKLTKYFLASLAIPDDDQWVNLSPYEKDRIIKYDFGKTEMGRDLLAQDYLLKQITASLIYPESQIGKAFWTKVYVQAQKRYGTSNIPVNTFNKVWIVPDSALIYEKDNMAYVVNHHLKVMLEEDYLSLQKHFGISTVIPAPDKSIQGQAPAGIQNSAQSIASRIIRQIVLPELQREVNEDKNFAALRQVYSGMILAAWFKRALKQSLLGRIYDNKAKVRGVDQDPKNNEAIYQRYIQAYKRGVFNYIQEDADRYTHETIPRKYFSGGTIGDGAMYAHIVRTTGNPLAAARDMAMLRTQLDDVAVEALPSAPHEGLPRMDRAQLNAAIIKAALADAKGTPWDKLKSHKNLEELILKKDFKIARLRVRGRENNLRQMKFLLKEDFPAGYIAYFQASVAKEPDSNKWPELIRSSFFRLMEDFLFESEMYYSDERGVLVKILGADGQTIAMEGKDARNKEVVVIYDKKNRSRQVLSLLDYEQRQPAVGAETAAPRHEEAQGNIRDIVEPEIDILKIAGAEDDIGYIVKEVLKGKPNLETLSDSGWQEIASQIYEGMLAFHGQGIVTPEFLKILNLYLSSKGLEAYIQKYLTPESKKPRPLNANDLVLIVEILHTFSLSLKDFDLRPEVLRFIPLDIVFRQVGGSYRLYRDMLSENHWIGRAWENAEIDRPTYAELKSRGVPKSVGVFSVGQAKAFFQAYYRVDGAPDFFKNTFRILMDFYYGDNEIQQSIFEHGSISPSLQKNITRQFEAYSLNQINNILGLRLAGNGVYVFSRVESATIYEGTISAEYDPDREALSRPSAGIQLRRAPRPINISYFDLPESAAKDSIETTTALINLKIQHLKNARVEFPLPIGVVFAHYAAPQKLVIRQEDINKLNSDSNGPSLYDQISRLNSFTAIPGSGSGYFQNGNQFTKNVERAFKNRKELGEKILEMVRPLMINQRTFLVTVTAKVDNDRGLMNVISREKGSPDFQRSLEWADDFMRMVNLFYKNGFVVADLNLADFYYDDDDIKAGRFLDVFKLTRASDGGNGKTIEIIDILNILLGVAFNFTKGEVSWEAVRELAQKDFKGQDLILANDFIAFLEAEYNSQGTLGQFLQHWKERIRSTDAAMQAESPGGQKDGMRELSPGAQSIINFFSGSGMKFAGLKTIERKLSGFNTVHSKPDLIQVLETTGRENATARRAVLIMLRLRPKLANEMWEIIVKHAYKDSRGAYHGTEVNDYVRGEALRTLSSVDFNRAVPFLIASLVPANEPSRYVRSRVLFMIEKNIKKIVNSPHADAFFKALENSSSLDVSVKTMAGWVLVNLRRAMPAEDAAMQVNRRTILEGIVVAALTAGSGLRLTRRLREVDDYLDEERSEEAEAFITSLPAPTSIERSSFHFYGPNWPQDRQRMILGILSWLKQTEVQEPKPVSYALDLIKENMLDASFQVSHRDSIRGLAQSRLWKDERTGKFHLDMTFNENIFSLDRLDTLITQLLRLFYYVYYKHTLWVQSNRMPPDSWIMANYALPNQVLRIRKILEGDGSIQQDYPIFAAALKNDSDHSMRAKDAAMKESGPEDMALNRFNSNLKRIKTKNGLRSSLNALANRLLGAEGARIFVDSRVFDTAWVSLGGDIERTGSSLGQLIDTSSHQKLTELKESFRDARYGFDEQQQIALLNFQDERLYRYVSAEEAVGFTMEKTQLLLSRRDAEWFRDTVVPKVNAWAAGNAKQMAEKLSGILDKFYTMKLAEWRAYAGNAIPQKDIALADELRAQLPEIIDGNVQALIKRGKAEEDEEGHISYSPYNVAGIAIGGSLARGEMTPVSDIEIVNVITTDGSNDDVGEFIEELETAVNRDVRRKFGGNIHIAFETDFNNPIRPGHIKPDKNFVIDDYPGGRVFYSREIDAPSLMAKLKHGDFHRESEDRAQAANTGSHRGGIDLNSANLNLRIKRDGRGVPPPLARQDLAQFDNIRGLDPVILSIKPVAQTPLFEELMAHP